MTMKDSFLNKLQPLENFPKLFEKKERFGTYNEKTLGFLLVGFNCVWAAPWENVSSGVSDQVRLKPACAATEAS